MESVLKNSPFSFQQQYLYTMLMLDPSDKSIPVIQTPEWILKLGEDLKNLFKQGKLCKIYFDINGKISVE